MSTVLEKELLWDELGLNGLLAGAGSGSGAGIDLNIDSLLLGGSPQQRLAAAMMPMALAVPGAPQFAPISQLNSKNKKDELKPLASLLQEQEFSQMGMKKVMNKHKKMIEKPTYAAIMGRYQSNPHQPKVISKAKLSELADPVLGKMSNADRKELERVQKIKEMEDRAYHYLPNQPKDKEEENDFQQLFEHLNQQQIQQENRSKHPYQQVLQKIAASPTKKSFQPHHLQQNHEDDDETNGGLFLTASNHSESKSVHQPLGSSPMRPYDQKGVMVSPQRDAERVAEFLERLKSSPHDKIDMNIKSSKNGFASLIRDRVNFAQKVGKITTKPSKIDENDVISAYQRYVSMKKEREKQLEQVRKVARSKPPKILPKMNKKSIEVINKKNKPPEKSLASAADKFKKVVPKKISSSGYSKEVKRYSTHSKPPAYSKSKNARLPSVPSISNAKRAQRDLTQEEELMMSNDSLGSSDDELMSNTFLTGMMKTNSRVTEPSSGISKVKSRLRNSMQQQPQTILPIPSTILEKPASTSKLTNRSQRKKGNDDGNIPKDSNVSEGLVASTSAPSSRVSLRQSSHRSNSVPSIAQAKQKALKPEQRFGQLKAMIEEEQEDLTQTTKPEIVQNSYKSNENEIDVLNAQNNYGKKRSMNNSSTNKLPASKSGSFQIPIMPRNTTESPTKSKFTYDDIDNELADADAVLQGLDDSENVQNDKEDIQSLISKLKKYESSMQTKGTSDLYVKPDSNAILSKHAQSLGGHFSNIDAMMDKINALKDGLE